MRRIGILAGLPESDSEAQGRVTVFVQGLDGAGWTEGRNIRIDIRWAGDDRKSCSWLTSPRSAYLGL
jgi:putative tryptophan/tyrosine transport system substrate-binding protein